MANLIAGKNIFNIQMVPLSVIEYSNPQASHYPYDEGITAWSCVAYQVTIKNNSNQSVTLFYNVHFRDYYTTTPGTIRYEGVLVGTNPTNGVTDPRFPALEVTIPANSSVTQNFNLSPYQVQLQLGNTMEISFIDFKNGYTINRISNPNGDGFSGDTVEAIGTETPVVKVSM